MTMTLERPDSTVRIEVLGEELRRLREAAGLTLLDVADQIGISQGHLSRLENGTRAQKIEDVASLLTVYGVVGEERTHLLAMTRKAGQPGFWQRQGSTFESRFATLKVLESRATSLVDFESQLIPGLLQTVPYAQAVFREVGLIEDQDEIDERVVGRIQRQAVLRGRGAPHLFALIAETALRNLVGGREVMRGQLTYLAEAAERRNVTLRILPTAVGGHPGLQGPFLRLQFADRPSVVFLDNRTSSLFLEEPEEIGVYNRMIVELMSMAASEEDSVRLVAEMAATLE